MEKIGINHIVTDLITVAKVYESFGELVDTITHLSEKPISKFNAWDKLKSLNAEWKDVEVWLDACKSICIQGKTSFSVFPDLTAARCSNLNDRISYTSLDEGWSKVKNQYCPNLVNRIKTQ